MQRETLHISDDTGRIAMLETRTAGTDSSAAEMWRYIFSNHLQSANLKLDEDGEIISYEEPKRSGALEQPLKINLICEKYYAFGGNSFLLIGILKE